MKKLVLAAAVVATVAIFPPTAPAASTFTGVVVAKSRNALAVASRSGTITTVHTRAHARIGTRVRVSGSSIRVIGLAHRVRLHAVVVRRAGSTIFLAGGHSLLAVHASRQLASVVASQPGTGAVINTTATITQSGQLNAGATQVVGELPEIEVQAVVTAVGPGTITLSVNGQPLTISLPAGIQLPATLVGQSVTLKLKLNEAEPVAEDEDQADNDDQGDDNDDQGDDDGGGGGDGD